MAIQFHRAQRKKAKLRLGIAGPAGGGKTYSALQIAFGLGGRIALIDTERGSGELYAHLGEYDVCSLDAPFTPEKYVEAIRTAESAGYDIIIIDSLSHAWAGPGGVLDIHGFAADRAGNSWAAWRQVTPRHNELVDALLMSSCHIIATMRSKMEHVQVVENGKTVIKKVGMNPIQRDGMEYEFTVFMDLDQSHTACATKDRTGLFDGQVFKPAQDTGKKLLNWLETGAQEVSRPGRQPSLVIVGGGQADGGAGTAGGVADKSAGVNEGGNTGGRNSGNNAGDNTAGRRPGAAGKHQNPQGPTAQRPTQAAGEGRQLHNTRQVHAQTDPAPAVPDRPIEPPQITNPNAATQAQIKKIIITAGEAGLNEAGLNQVIEQETGKPSVKELAKQEASRVIDLLLGMAKGQRSQRPEPTAPLSQAGNGRMRLF